MYAYSAQWLKDYITVHWIVLESSSIHQQSDQNFYRYTTFLFLFTIFSRSKSVNVYQKAKFLLVQILFSIGRNTRRVFGRSRRRLLLLSQHFGHFTDPPPNTE